MKAEKIIRVDEVQGGDEIRFEHQRKYRRVKAALPMSGGKILIIIPDHDNFLRDKAATVYRKI